MVATCWSRESGPIHEVAGLAGCSMAGRREFHYSDWSGHDVGGQSLGC
jgi:hypothetical protein